MLVGSEVYRVRAAAVSIRFSVIYLAVTPIYLFLHERVTIGKIVFFMKFRIILTCYLG